MPWLRIGDTSASHPVVLAVLEHADCDDRLLNETFGFVLRCAVQSTAHLTDYVITHGTAVQIAGPSRAAALIEQALAAGYFTEVLTVEGGRTAYKLIDDDAEFIHMRTREEIEWERQRKLDNSNPDLTIPARLRDGDACRYCGLIVSFGARRGSKRGTYDHLTPGRRASSPEDLVVACEKCNSTLLDSPRAHREAQLMPVPKRPYFRPATLVWLSEHEYVQTHNIVLPTASEPDVKAGRVPPGRDRGTPATRAGQTPPTIPARSEGTRDTQPRTNPAGAPVRPVGPSDSQSHGDPADTSPARSEGTHGSQPRMNPAGAPVRSEGLSDTQSERDPADTVHGSGPLGISTIVDDPAEPPACSSGPPGPHRVDPADEPEKPPAPPGPDPSSRNKQKPAERHHLGSGYAGTGRDGTGRVGSVRVGAGRSGAAQPPSRPSPDPGSHMSTPPLTRRRRR